MSPVRSCREYTADEVKSGKVPYVISMGRLNAFTLDSASSSKPKEEASPPRAPSSRQPPRSEEQ